MSRARSESAAYLIRISRTTLISATAVAILFAVFGHLSWGLGALVGALWAVANLIFLRFILVRWLKAPGTGQGGPSLALIGGLVLKFPLLYGLGYLLLASGWFRIEGLVIGFITPFAAAFGHALAQFAADRRQMVSL